MLLYTAAAASFYQQSMLTANEVNGLLGTYDLLAKVGASKQSSENESDLIEGRQRMNGGIGVSLCGVGDGLKRMQLAQSEIVLKTKGDVKQMLPFHGPFHHIVCHFSLFLVSKICYLCHLQQGEAARHHCIYPLCRPPAIHSAHSVQSITNILEPQARIMTLTRSFMN